MAIFKSIFFWVLFFLGNFQVNCSAEISRDFKEQEEIFMKCQKLFKADSKEQKLLDEMQLESEKKYMSKRELKKLKEKIIED